MSCTVEVHICCQSICVCVCMLCPSFRRTSEFRQIRHRGVRNSRTHLQHTLCMCATIECFQVRLNYCWDPEGRCQIPENGLRMDGPIQRNYRRQRCFALREQRFLLRILRECDGKLIDKGTTTFSGSFYCEPLVVTAVRPGMVETKTWTTTTTNNNGSASKRRQNTRQR